LLLCLSLTIVGADLAGHQMNQHSAHNSSIDNVADEYEPQGLSIADVVAGLWRFRWSSVAIVACTTLLAAIVAFTSTPIYRAEVLLSPLADDGVGGGGLGGIVRQLGDFAPLVGMGGGLGSVGLKEETMALVKSRTFLVQFIQGENLMPVLYPELAERSASAPDDDAPSVGDAYRRFGRSVLSVQEDKDSGLVRLAIEWRDPKIAASWANKLVRRINDHMRTRAIDEAQRSIGYLQKELEKTSVLGVQDSIYRLVESHISQITLANARDGYAFRVIDPAVPAEERDFVKPRRVLLIALGVVGGALLAFFVVLVRLTWRQKR
jgi:uncharacterized protein involved in exopolysaccharide biosynthesis